MRDFENKSSRDEERRQKQQKLMMAICRFIYGCCNREHRASGACYTRCDQIMQWRGRTMHWTCSGYFDRAQESFPFQPAFQLIECLVSSWQLAVIIMCITLRGFAWIPWHAKRHNFPLRNGADEWQARETLNHLRNKSKHELCCFHFALSNHVIP